MKLDAITLIKFKKLNPEAVTPSYAKLNDAGVDLYSMYDIEIKAGGTFVVPTGLAFEIPVGYEMQVRPRSGVSSQGILSVFLGTVDAGYRGEVGVIVKNTSTSPVLIKKNDRIAQAVVNKIPYMLFQEVDELSTTSRGETGFGSTGGY